MCTQVPILLMQLRTQGISVTQQNNPLNSLGGSGPLHIEVLLLDELKHEEIFIRAKHSYGDG